MATMHLFAGPTVLDPIAHRHHLCLQEKKAQSPGPFRAVSPHQAWGPGGWDKPNTLDIPSLSLQTHLIWSTARQPNML